jgi:hypothetical protein
MEAAEGQKFSAASRRAIEIVMVMNSQPTLHDSKPMLCRGILLLLNTKKYLRAQQIAPHIPGAMQREEPAFGVLNTTRCSIGSRPPAPTHA